MIQVIDNGADKNFDGFIDAFKEITGPSTGIFPISFAQVPCPVSPYGGVATVTAGSRYFIIVVFSDFKMPISSADVALGYHGLHMVRNQGVFQVSIRGNFKGSVRVTVELQGGGIVRFNHCFPKWPVGVSTSCRADGGETHAIGPAPSPS